MQLSPATAPTHSEIEVIVRAVLERLRTLEGAPAAPVATATATATTTTVGTVPAVAQPGEIHLDQRLVTLEDLRDRWDTMKSLLVPKRCIVTPAALDELRQRGVVLHRSDGVTRQATSENPAQGSKSLLVMMPAGKKADSVSQLCHQGIEVASIGQDNNLALTTLKNHLAEPHKLCVWSSPRPFAAARACTVFPHVAAVQLSRIEDLPLAIEQAQPNVLILDDRSWTVSNIANLARSWLINQRGRSSSQ